jgi:AbiV family abortive infection protein
LFDFRTEVIAGEVVTKKQIKQVCNDHSTKQRRGVLSTVLRADNSSTLGKLLWSSFAAPLHSEERRVADEHLKTIDERQRRRAPDERHQQRMRSLYVDPDNSSWNRPVLSVGQEQAYNWLNDLANDYSLVCQKVEPALLTGHDEQLLQEITDWSERPELPRPV